MVAGRAAMGEIDRQVRLWSAVAASSFQNGRRSSEAALHGERHDWPGFFHAKSMLLRISRVSRLVKVCSGRPGRTSLEPSRGAGDVLGERRGDAV